MNLHLPQNIESRLEIENLVTVKRRIMSAQSSKPNIKIVQDSLLGAYLMTDGIQKINQEDFFNICMKIVTTYTDNKGNKIKTHLDTKDILYRMQHIRRVMKEKGKKVQCFTGKGLYSMILPLDFNYTKRNNANELEPVVKIYKGVLYEGTIDKNIIGSCHGSIIQYIYKEYGVDEAVNFIDNTQFIPNEYIVMKGFSINIEDSMLTNIERENEIKGIIKECLIEADNVKKITKNPIIREIKTMSALNKAKDIGLKIAKDSLNPNNNFIKTVKSGAKGDFYNIAQITGLLGQQHIKGRRFKPILNNGKRTLPHYHFSDLTLEEEYESQGFVFNSFFKGLNPKEMFFSACSAREGVCNTAQETANTGYTQRRIIKLMEDIKIQYDGTVRDVVGKIYQFSYGETGYDPVETIKVGDKQDIIDVGRVIDRLNMKRENKINKSK